MARPPTGGLPPKMLDEVMHAVARFPRSSSTWACKSHNELCMAWPSQVLASCLRGALPQELVSRHWFASVKCGAMVARVKGFNERGQILELLLVRQTLKFDGIERGQLGKSLHAGTVNR